MKNTSNTPPSGWLSALRKTVAVVALTGVSMGVAMAAPLAGSVIGNQAAATYTDASAIVRTATSNTVTTTVTQVAGVTLVAGLTVTAAPGQPVSLPHTLTNTGNGTDTFTLTNNLTTGTALLSAITYFPDTNCDGVADSGSPAITSLGPLVAGAKACFVAVTTVGAAVPSGSTGSNIVTVTTAANGGATASNTDNVVVSTNAVIGVTKSLAVTVVAGVPNLTYTLTYTNTGNAAATDVMLTDIVPTGTTYLPASAKWNGTAVADGAVAAGVPPAGGITYDYNKTTPGNFAVTARVASVAANSGGTLSFTVTVPAGTAPGTINNTAHFCYNNGVALVPLASTTANCVTNPNNQTNTVPYVVAPTYSAVATDYFQAPNLQGASAVAATTSSTTDLGLVAGVPSVKNDIVTVQSATPGASVAFDNVVANTGNAVDTFNITTAPTAGTPFPSGTTFLYFKAGGVTPLTDSNGDGIVDTGPLAPGAATHVFVIAVLPGNASGVNLQVNMTATSVGNGASDSVMDVLNLITPNSVNMTSVALAGATAATGLNVNTTAVLGAADNGAVAIVTNPVLPGASTTFTLVVNNTSGIADTYGVTVDPLSNLPAGWAVNFYSANGTCATPGAPMSNTGVVLANTPVTVCAIVTVPAGEPANAAGQAVVFKVASPTTGVVDFMKDAVTVTTVRSIALTPNNGSQVYPGGTVVYKHVLTNTGNVIETAVTVPVPSVAGASMTGSTVSWGAVLYADTAGGTMGSLDAADVALGSLSLAPGASVTIFTKVLSPASAAAGDVNTVILTATASTYTGGATGVAVPASATAQDVTTVISGQIGLAKLQQVDAGCAGTIVPANWTNAQLAAKPGECVLYQITATNLGTANATSLVISDATPANTTYACKQTAADALANTVVAGTGAALAAISAGTVTPVAAAGACSPATITGTVGTLAPGASAVLTFGVQIIH